MGWFSFYACCCFLFEAGTATRFPSLPKVLLMHGGSSDVVEQKRNSSTKASAPPVIDISVLLNDDADLTERAAVITAIGKACRQWGFFQVVNHGLPQETHDAFSTAMKSFFRLPLEQKLRLKRTESNSRGFAHDELTKQLKDRKELFDLGHVPHRSLPHDHELNRVLDGYNQWPSDALEETLGGFQDPVMRYYDACASLSRTLMGALAESLGLAKDYFEANNAGTHHGSSSSSSSAGASSAEKEEEELAAEDEEGAVGPETEGGGFGTSSQVGRLRMEPHTSYLRLNHYPVLSELTAQSESRGPLGVSRHTDAGALTVLLQDEVAALEVYSGTKEEVGDGAWVAVNPVPGALTINLGDMVQVWSNGLYCAPEHRVRASTPAKTGTREGGDDNEDGKASDGGPGGERFSAPFFYNPSYAAVVEPIPELSLKTYSGILHNGGGGDDAKAAAPKAATAELAAATATTGAQAMGEGEEGNEEPSGPASFEVQAAAARVAVAMTPKYHPISWGAFRRQRFEGDFADRGREVQIEDFRASPPR